MEWRVSNTAHRWYCVCYDCPSVVYSIKSRRLDSVAVTQNVSRRLFNPNIDYSCFQPPFDHSATLGQSSLFMPTERITNP